jgi:cell division protein FtsW (lipid II flippase)
LAKICFVFVGTASLDTLVTRKNLLFFVLYTGAVCLCLALLSDFGTALVFFVAFLVIAFLRSGNFAAVTLISAAAAFGGMLATRFLPYITRRFSAWRHVWEHALTGGYQQTRSMMCIASGGLLGLGAGQGWLKYVAAADTDLVFAFVSEELGLLFATIMVLYVVLLGLYVLRAIPHSRGCFQSIGACAAVSIFLTQTVLNVFGTVDLLPLTGVTFPFVSNGGSSMICVWGLLAFIKACDTRQNGSFAVPLLKKRREKDE